MPKTLKPLEILNAQGAQAMLDAVKDAAGDDLTIDCSEVRHLGAQALQVLLSARKTWGNAGHQFALVNMSEPCREALVVLGVSDLFADEVPT